MRTHYTLVADGLSVTITLTDDPATCYVEVDAGDGKVRVPMSAATAARELRRAITAMLDHRATLTTREG